MSVAFNTGTVLSFAFNTGALLSVAFNAGPLLFVDVCTGAWLSVSFNTGTATVLSAVFQLSVTGEESDFSVSMASGWSLFDCRTTATIKIRNKNRVPQNTLFSSEAISTVSCPPRKIFLRGKN